MKPEETDRHIQQLLEEIDSIPSLAWNEARVWNKITFKLMFPWWFKILAVLAILSILTVYLLWPAEKKQFKTPSEKRTELRISIHKKDSINTNPEKISIRKKKHRTAKSGNCIHTIRPEQKAAPQPHQLIPWSPRYKAFQKKQYKINSFYGLNLPDSMPEINLRIPALHMVNVDVNNSFNAKNLIRSLEKEDNSHTYYRYRYNSRYLPDPFNNNINQQEPAYQPQIIKYP